MKSFANPSICCAASAPFCLSRPGLGRLGRWSLALGFALLSVAAQAQQKAGEIAQLQGMATAQQPGSAARFLGRGDQVLEGDVISTTDKGFAVVNLADGTRFTLRPSTVFALERFSHDQGTESAVMRLLKGGMRVATGLISKRNPGGVELKVNTATIGIRGTSFDARICGDDCRQEGVAPVAAAAAPPAASSGPVVARVVQASGDVAATQPGKPARPLAVGAALYEGDDVRSGPGAVAVLGFRDQSKVSVNPDTTLRINAFAYNRPQVSDNMALSLLKGGLRVFTGLIGKKTTTAFTVTTRTSTIGIRGTGMDISCEGPCVDESLGGAPSAASTDGANPKQTDGLFMFTWQGGTYFVAGPLEVPLNQVGFIGRDGLARLLAAVPEFFNSFSAPRPDQIEVDWDNLFATVEPNGSDGIYILVRDGHVFMTSGARQVDLGIGEAGYIGQLGLAQRIVPPGFLVLDPFPLPDNLAQSGARVFRLLRVTQGKPGQEICRL